MLVKFEQNGMVQNIKKLELFGKKWLTIFEKVLTPFLKNFSVTLLDATVIFHCSKNYGSPTRITWLKVAPNMVDPISINQLTDFGEENWLLCEDCSKNYGSPTRITRFKVAPV